MCQEDQAAKDDRRARRKRTVRTVGRVLLLLMGCAYYGVFIKIVWTGYLTWIGITVGTLFLAPNVVFSAIGLSGKEALEERLWQVFTCTMVVAIIAIAALLLWPERAGTWRPYNFDAEVAALEAERTVPDEENAALRYEAALATVDVNDRRDLGNDGASLMRELSQQPWRAKDQPEVSAWLDAHATIVDELLQIGQMEKCRWPVNTELGVRGAVPYKKLSHGTRLLALIGNRYLGEDRLEEALQACFCLLRSAEHMRQQPSGVDFLVAFSHERPALQMIRHILVQGRLTTKDIERIAQRLPTATDTWHEDIARLLAFDEYRFAQFIAPVYEIDEQGNIRFAASFSVFSDNKQRPQVPTRWGRLARLYCYMNMPPDPQGVWAMAKDESARMAHLLELGSLLRIPDDQLFLERPSFDLVTTLFANASRWMARSMCFDASMYDHHGEYYATCLAKRRGTWLVLGLRRYRDEHGAWPETLDALAEHVPADAFEDPTCRGPFVYVLDNGSFKLHSTGLNRIDEGGRDDYVKTLGRCEDDIAIWPPYVRKPEPETKESIELMKKQLKEIYGEDVLRDKE